MKTVGVRELKNRLSEYIRHVRSGEAVLVTDRGEVVAELAAPGHGAPDSGLPHGLLALSRSGLVTLGVPTTTTELYPAFRGTRRRRRAAELLDEERGSR